MEALKLVPGYAPPATSQIQLATLDTLQTDYRAANKGAATTGAVMTKAERARKALYDGETNSLRAKMKGSRRRPGRSMARRARSLPRSRASSFKAARGSCNHARGLS